jgi:hypothetical protein
LAGGGPQKHVFSGLFRANFEFPPGLDLQKRVKVCKTGRKPPETNGYLQISPDINGFCFGPFVLSFDFGISFLAISLHSFPLGAREKKASKASFFA